MHGDYTLPVEPGNRVALRRLHHRGRPRLRRKACRSAFALQARRSLRQPQGRRPARGDDRDQPVHHRLGRAGRAPARRPRTAPNMSTSWSARTQGPARSLAGTAGYSAPAKASARRRPGSIATCSRPRASLRVNASRRHPGAVARGHLPPEQCRQARPEHLRPGRGRPPRSPRLQGLYRPPAGPGLARIDADLAEDMDLGLWRRADRDQRGPDRLPAVSRSRTPSSSPESAARSAMTARTACSIRPGASGSRPSSTRRRRFASPASPISATSSTAASIIPPARISSSPAAPGSARSTAPRSASWRRRGGSMPAAADRCAASASRSWGRGSRSRTPISTRRSRREGRSDPLHPDRRPKPDRIRGSRPATASAITESSASSTPARSMKARLPDCPTCASGSASAAGSTPISGRLRADVAMPIGRRKGESRFAVYVSIGQAF